MAITMKEALRRSKEPGLIAEVRKLPGVFTDVDRSITYHRRNHIEEPWDEWEWPRRLAELAMVRSPSFEQMQEQAYQDIYGEGDSHAEDGVPTHDDQGRVEGS